ncbi:ABC transporter permease [Pelagibacterium nitratireducens]|uniref:ABC transporter permease n=1 Tax=Pelagibacterium nitratireducens TaxID=1046114 RepID=A0ABZ2I7V9_9HYPH|nr:peptide ABC transporter permease [Pelagibacterium sp.]HCO55696.1 peptide ABC transporter permease [Pelagibacterium sp.]|tara:strand:+ start:3025 stop:3942 length:918 start_codon:yes stop_codon:yes gene_type:complete
MVETLKVFLRNRKAAFGLLIVLAYVLVAVFGPMILGADPMARVGRPHTPPDGEALMGTTRMGRDVFSQLVYGTRTSLAVGFFAGLLVVMIGTVLGIAAGYFGGVIDEIINFCTNVVLVIPQLPLLLVIAAFVGQTSPVVIAIIIGVTSWAWGARVTRAQTMTLRQREYIQASELIGEPAHRMIFVELLPNLLSIIGFNFIGSVTYTIITQATLEFLGLGNPMSVSWGTMLYHAQNSSAITVGAWWEVLAPAVAVAGIGIGLSLLNFGVDEISNPRLRTLGTIAAAAKAQEKLDRQRAAGKLEAAQ